MTTADLVILPEQPARRRFWRLSTTTVTILALAAFLFIAQHVIDSGFVRRDIEALLAGEAWRTGGWLSQLVLNAVGLIPNLLLQQTTLSLTAAAVVGAMFGVLYDRLRRNGWFAFGAVAILLALGLHAGVLYATTAASRALPLYFAFAVLIPAIKRFEDVGDVQSSIGLGLLMPLVLLAGPITTPLIIPLALFAALATPDGRRDPRAFVAMLLVSLIPAFIVALGIVGFVAQAGLDLNGILLPYIAAYGTIKLGDIVGALATLAVFSPVMLVPLLYCIWPKLPTERHVFSALAVIAMPLYISLARVTFNTTMQPIVPSVALLAAFASWLSVTRLPFALRALSLIMLVVATAFSWAPFGLWDDPAWKAALFSPINVLPFH